MGKQTKVTWTCDSCQGDITGSFVDADYYGMAFHEECWLKANGTGVIKLLGIRDTIKPRHTRDG